MILRLLLFLPLIAIADEAAFLKSKEQADKFVVALYMHPATEKFCRANPTKQYVVKYASRSVTVPCDVRNDWVDLQEESN